MTVITDPYVLTKQKSKTRRYQEGLITVQMVQAEERRINPPPVRMKRTHKGYPPDGVCPCPECRKRARG